MCKILWSRNTRQIGNFTSENTCMCGVTKDVSLDLLDTILGATILSNMWLWLEPMSKYKQSETFTLIVKAKHTVDATRWNKVSYGIGSAQTTTLGHNYRETTKWRNITFLHKGGHFQTRNFILLSWYANTRAHRIYKNRKRYIQHNRCEVKIHRENKIILISFLIWLK